MDLLDGLIEAHRQRRLAGRLEGLTRAVGAIATWLDQHPDACLIPASSAAERVLGAALSSGRWPSLSLAAPGDLDIPPGAVVECMAAGPAEVYRTHHLLDALGVSCRQTLLLDPIGDWFEALDEVAVCRSVELRDQCHLVAAG